MRMSELRAWVSTIVALGIIATIAALMPWENDAAPAPLPTPVAVSTTSQSASAAPASLAPASTTREIVATSTPALPPPAAEPLAQSPAPDQAVRITDPYDTPPLAFETVNADARASLVNIFCVPHGGSLNPISGSGVIVDPRGIILTNAHVAQYVLLAESTRVDLSCMVRAGSPAVARHTPEVILMPPSWVETHASEIRASKPEGTGEHDWALMRLVPLKTSSVPSPLPAALPNLSADTRPAIGFVGDQVLAAGYPAEFIGGSIAQTGLYPVSSISTIDQLLTFSASSTVDLVSIGSVIEAQGGSSGGPVVNRWDKLIGIITTTSAGSTTADRTLRALTTDYIDRDMRALAGFGLSDLASQDPAALRAQFLDGARDALTSLFIAHLR